MPNQTPDQIHPGMRCIALMNQKGGVGKTTSSVNLAAAWARAGHRTLVVDLDPQAHATLHLGLDPDAPEGGVEPILLADDSEAHAVAHASVVDRSERLSVLGASTDLAAAEHDLAGVANRHHRLRAGLDHLSERFDVVVIDCPPSLNLLTVNAMTAADSVLVPLQCEFFALEGLSQLMRTIELVRGNLNKTLVIQGVVLTMYDKRNNLSAQVAADVREHFGDTVYDTVIPRNVRVSEAPSFGKPVLLYDLQCSGAQAYLQLAREVVRQERSGEAALAPA
jgi:chromosome partitioning protein